MTEIQVADMTREHVMSIRGYTIVDPHGSRSAEGLTARASYRQRLAADRTVEAANSGLDDSGQLFYPSVRRIERGLADLVTFTPAGS